MSFAYINIITTICYWYCVHTKGGNGFMQIIIVIVIILIPLLFPVVPFIIRNIPNILHYGISDIYNFFRYKRYNECRDFGKVITICASGTKVFGSGKTLSGVHAIRYLFNKYDGLEVWNPTEQKFVTQHIHVISNVELKDIPFTYFENERQLIEVEQPEMDITLFFLDEASSIWNSRNYKDNISTDLLTSLLQCRKNKIALITTSQRFIFQDKLIRQITSEVWEAYKMWRFVRLQTFDAYDMENCTNLQMLRSLATSFWFVKDSDYEAYDTTAIVERLKKMNDNGELLSDSEILENQGVSDRALEMVERLSRKGKKRLKS